MVSSVIKRQILEDLDQLSPDQQYQAVEWVHALAGSPRQGASIADLLRFHGTMDPESAREISEAIA